MALQRMLTEMGMGVDIRGGDFTKAARRAVADALRHSSLSFFPAFDSSPADMQITVLIGVAEPDQVDAAAVAAELPYGTVEVKIVHGGLQVPADQGIDALTIANAAVIVSLNIL